jgi:hypothetical protein
LRTHGRSNEGGNANRKTVMELLHALADTGQDGCDSYMECTCGMRTWGDDDWAAWEAFKAHKRMAQLEVPQSRGNRAMYVESGARRKDRPEGP